MTIRIDDPGLAHGGGALRSAIALALAALVASATGAGAGAPRTGDAWSSGFDDWLWTGNSPVRPETPPLAGWAEQCLVGCDPGFGTYSVRRTELLSSNAADVSVNAVADSTGHRMGVSGMIVIERLAPDGLQTDWVVTGERTLDSDGTHSWSLLSPNISPDARWLPIQLYRVEDVSAPMTFAAAASASATPEASTWAMTLIGFVGLSVAGYRRSRKRPRPVHFFEGTYRR
jgi:hypothetical protein